MASDLPLYPVCYYRMSLLVVFPYGGGLFPEGGAIRQHLIPLDTAVYLDTDGPFAKELGPLRQHSPCTIRYDGKDIYVKPVGQIAPPLQRRLGARASENKAGWISPTRPYFYILHFLHFGFRIQTKPASQRALRQMKLLTIINQNV